MANKAKIFYMIECQTKIAQGLERSLKVLREEADNEKIQVCSDSHGSV